VWLVLAVTAGCAGPRTHLLQGAPADPGGETRPGGKYRLEPGDQLDVKFYYNTELNESLTVGPDGFISLQLVGEVQAAGSTPGELSEQLHRLYTGRIPDPEVTVIARSFASQVAYVGGEVANPGTCELRGRMTCAQALLSRGGARSSARLSQALLIRFLGPDSTLVRQVNLDRVLDGDVPDIRLQAYDVLYVPKTSIARVGQFVQQFINDIVPRSLSFPYALNSHITVQ
jgi:protein involved in polysaccharide export with SLBB domain